MIHTAELPPGAGHTGSLEDEDATPVINGIMNPVIRSVRLVWDGPFTLVNARTGHWSKHAAENAKLRRWAEKTGTDQGVVFGGPVTIEALMTVHRGVLPDCDAIAAAVKPVIDGIVDAGLILDDSPEHVRSITYHAPRRSDGRRLVVLIKESTLRPKIPGHPSTGGFSLGEN